MEKKFIKKYGIILSLSTVAAMVIGAEKPVSSMKEPLPLKFQAIKPMVEKWLASDNPELVRKEFNANPPAVRDVVTEYVNYPMFKGQYNRLTNKYDVPRSYLFHLIASFPMGTAHQIETILILGANIDVSNEFDELGRTPLILAVAKDRPDRPTNEIVKTLIQHGAHVNAQDNTYRTALDYASAHWASYNKNQNIIDMLKEAGAKTNAQLQLESGQTMQAKQPFVQPELLIQPAIQ